MTEVEAHGAFVGLDDDDRATFKLGTLIRTERMLVAAA